jgi:hypothetical protein
MLSFYIKLVTICGITVHLNIKRCDGTRYLLPSYVIDLAIVLETVLSSFSLSVYTLVLISRVCHLPLLESDRPSCIPYRLSPYSDEMLNISLGVGFAACPIISLHQPASGTYECRNSNSLYLVSHISYPQAAETATVL